MAKNHIHRVELDNCNLNIETNYEFRPKSIYHGRFVVDANRREALLKENRPRGPRNQPVYCGRYLAVSFSRRLNRYWWRFVCKNMTAANAADFSKELKLAQKAVLKHGNDNCFVEK